MITPRFECSQTDNYVTIKIKVPYAKVSEMEYYVLENEFKFFVKPYFLRLTFKEKLNSEEGSDKSSYDIDKGEVTIEIAKSEPGKQFPDLNMLTSLLAKPNPSKQKISKPKIEVLSSQTFENENENNNENNKFDPSFLSSPSPPTSGEFDAEVDLQADQLNTDATTMPALRSKEGYGYGFDDQYEGVFRGWSEEDVAEVIAVPDVEHTTRLERRERAHHAEDAKWDEDHYVADFMVDDEIQRIIKMKTRYKTEHKILKKCESILRSNESLPSKYNDIVVRSGSDSVTLRFNDHEREMMLQLPRKEYLIDHPKQVFYTLISILFGYAYNYRTTEGENNVESSWTVRTLSTPLSYLLDFDSLDSCLRNFIRRVLTFPLFRHFHLAQQTILDAADILEAGRECCLRCLLEAREIMQNTESQHILNRIFLDDYCVWIQGVATETLQKWATEIRETIRRIEKKDNDFWDILELEELAVEAQKQFGDSVGNNGDVETTGDDDDDEGPKELTC